jgi:hypothetical protein
VETSTDGFDSWIDAHEAGNAALIGYVEEISLGPVRSGPGNDLDDQWKEVIRGFAWASFAGR